MLRWIHTNTHTVVSHVHAHIHTRVSHLSTQASILLFFFLLSVLAAGDSHCLFVTSLRVSHHYAYEAGWSHVPPPPPSATPPHSALIDRLTGQQTGACGATWQVEIGKWVDQFSLPSIGQKIEALSLSLSTEAIGGGGGERGVQVVE